MNNLIELILNEPTARLDPELSLAETTEAFEPWLIE